MALKLQAIGIETLRLVNLRTAEEEKKLEASPAELLEIDEKIKDINRQIFDVESLPLDKLFDIPADSFRWHEISFETVMIDYLRNFKKLTLMFFFLTISSNFLAPPSNCNCTGIITWGLEWIAIRIGQ